MVCALGIYFYILYHFTVLQQHDYYFARVVAVVQAFKAFLFSGVFHYQNIFNREQKLQGYLDRV